MNLSARLYFHSPCFDGIVSAVLTSDFAERVLNWTIDDLQPVTYKLRSSWLADPLVEPCAVVDFLYHPKATFWADHHPTTFLSPQVKRDFALREGPYATYNPRADSCAKLLWDHLKRAFQYRNHGYTNLVSWASKIDAAKYSSVTEAIQGTEPALRINFSLVYGDDDGYTASLVRHLRNRPLEAVADLPEVTARYQRFQLDVKRGLRFFRSHARLDRGVVVFDVNAEDMLIPRYAPYQFFPHARYSAGVIRREAGTTIIAMRNPWKGFAGIHMGKLFERIGGGGHARVGSVVLRGEDALRADAALNQVLTALQEDRRRLRRVSGSHSR